MGKTPPSERRWREDWQSIRNSTVRRKVRKGLQQQAKDARRGRRKDPKRIPQPATNQRTVERMREADESLLPPDDEEVLQDTAFDEFQHYFDAYAPKDAPTAAAETPKLFVTTSLGTGQLPSRRMKTFLKEFTKVIPNCHYYQRGRFDLATVAEFAADQGFSHLLAWKEKRGQGYAAGMNGLYVIKLPEGPSTYWRMSRLKLAQDMQDGAKLTLHQPELMLNNFDTRLGQRLGRMIASLFPQRPEFEGRRVICFHNQRDYVFFRHYRYVFKNGKKVSLQEIGPRFTLKCRYVQEGIHDRNAASYEYLWTPRSQVSRKRFFV
eukprot:Filipodium_phascolosomae@DN2836_c0_g1_i1.p1